MLEPNVELLDSEDYKTILKEKWRLFNSNFDEKHWNVSKKCILNQNEYLDAGKVQPLKFTIGDNMYVFLQIIPEKFISLDEKTQFLKETKFLRIVDFQLHQEEPLDLMSYLTDYQPSNDSDLLPLTQLFIKKK
jgi:hypothetical protein